MQTITEENIVIQKTLELCEAILEQPNYQTMRRQIEAFMADDKAKSQYDAVLTKGQALQQKQEMSLPLDGAEVTDFESHRDALLKNPVARGFLDAQDELQQLQQSVTQYVTKTLELGRVPKPEDMESGSCGHGCGCHH